MIILWAALLFLHQGCKLKTAHLGEAATLTCARTTKELSSRVQWYKQSVGDTLNLVVTFYGTTQPVYTPEFPESRFEAKIDKNFVNLTIVKTVQEDEGYYHCEQGSRVSSEWSGMYLSVKGMQKKERKTNNLNFSFLTKQDLPDKLYIIIKYSAFLTYSVLDKQLLQTQDKLVWFIRINPVCVVCEMECLLRNVNEEK
uniref:Ig-like domain-containing protein n=1 Tax=Neolamprologus brichardi TaxID=32507 RepID=A0A3Q4H7D9_NEOBR